MVLILEVNWSDLELISPWGLKKYVFVCAISSSVKLSLTHGVGVWYLTIRVCNIIEYIFASVWRHLFRLFEEVIYSLDLRFSFAPYLYRVLVA